MLVLFFLPAILSFPVHTPFTALKSPEFFEAADRDGNGQLDFDEFLRLDQAYVHQRLLEFVEADHDHSEQVSLDEFNAYNGKNDESHYEVVGRSKNDSDDDVVIIHRPEVLELSNANVETAGDEDGGADGAEQKKKGDVQIDDASVAADGDDAKEDEDKEDAKADDVAVEVDDDDDDEEETYHDDTDDFGLGFGPEDLGFRSVVAVQGNLAVSMSPEDVASSELITVFKAYDDDGDGVLNAEELLPYIQDFMEYAVKRSTDTIIKRYDGNGDGGLDPQELKVFEDEKPSDLIESLVSSSEGEYENEAELDEYGYPVESSERGMISDHEY